MSSEPQASGSVTVTGEIDLGHDRGRVALIYLARNGESGPNISGESPHIWMYHLSEKGQQQAKLLGDDLADVKFTRMYSSTYSCTIETAQVAIDQSKHSHSKDIQLKTDERIIERDDAYYLRYKYSAANELIWEEFDSENPFFPNKPWVIAKMVSRQQSFFDELFDDLEKSESPETVLIVTHDFFIRVLLMSVCYLKKYEQKTWDPELFTRRTENCGYHVIEISKEVCEEENKTKYYWDFIKIHETEHLKTTGLAKQDGGAGARVDDRETIAMIEEGLLCTRHFK